MIRILDIIFSLLGIALLLPFIFFIALILYFESRRPLFIQERVGKRKRPFLLMKFRTMRLETVSTATHLVGKDSITKSGIFLRKSKLDELPQLWNVLKGDMSLVGPRPNLFNQEELIHERSLRGVYDVRPGITGLAQINEIDMSTPKLLAEKDAEMIANLNIANYFKYIFLTISGKGQGDRVK